MQVAGAAGAPWLRRTALAFAGLAALLLVWPLVRLPLRLAVAYNEGWNAYHASHWREVAALYPDPAALLTNNYPPLSFVLNGMLGDLAGDHLLAGRAVALLALLWTCAAVAILVRRHGGIAAAGLAAGAWLYAVVAIHAPGYTAIDDPQWLGHALLATALLLVDGRRPAAAAACAVLALLVKHTLLPLPVALTLVLLATDRPLAWRWLGWGVAWAALGAGACLGIWGPGMARAMLASEGARATSLGNLVAVAWPLVPALLPALGLTLWIAWSGRGRMALAAAAYALLALLFGTFIARAYGVAASAFLDLAIATAIGSGLALARLAQGQRGLLVAAGAMALAVLPGLPGRAWQHAQSLAALPRDLAETGEAIAFLAARPAPVLCENLALCYWAGQPAAADFFNTGQKMLGGVVPEEALTAPIRARAFAAIQLERERPGNDATRRPGLGDNRLPLAVEAAIREAYPNAAAFGRAGRVLTP